MTDCGGNVFKKKKKDRLPEFTILLLIQHEIKLQSALKDILTYIYLFLIKVNYPSVRNNHIRE